MIQPSLPPRTTSLHARLVAAALPSGGWLYYAGQRGRIEPTCWALLALAGAKASDDVRVAARGVEFLRSLQRDDGLLIESGVTEPNYAWNALALFVLTNLGSAAPSGMADKLTAALLAVKGIQVDDRGGVFKQDASLQAWSWTPQTFSWIEPTAYAVLAVRKRGPIGATAAARLAEAEAVILDRVCGTGGWNYGNSQVLSQDLRPYVPTTALALVAMQHRRDHPAVVKSLNWLSSHALAERSAMALSLAAIALRVFGRPVDPVLQALREQDAKTGALGNVHLMAMTGFALAIPSHGASSFTYA